jgi:hypothetical protein
VAVGMAVEWCRRGGCCFVAGISENKIKTGCVIGRGGRREPVWPSVWR